jgi:hypothetical protein
MSNRGITVDGRRYEYKVGDGTTVIRASDGCVVDKAPNHEIVGVTPDTFARGRWKRTSDAVITPKLVAARIRSRTGIRRAT